MTRRAGEGYEHAVSWVSDIFATRENRYVKWFIYLAIRREAVQSIAAPVFLHSLVHHSFAHPGVSSSLS
ncbi:hypothetical protein [Halobacillus amylolyticus]|uniref:Uncharacterized protein n=1 Tax=Halobacillus amylolyticus TaxID=2932259 RepID=A0ABY4HBC3_9BACI|nr:hypothetical protein [Halobacillus amylolyticus]UOR11698.1 hypothetical protein MUO15_19360 [Halobacillus amylolyticus]